MKIRTKEPQTRSWCAETIRACSRPTPWSSFVSGILVCRSSTNFAALDSVSTTENCRTVIGPLPPFWTETKLESEPVKTNLRNSCCHVRSRLAIMNFFWGNQIDLKQSPNKTCKYVKASWIKVPLNSYPNTNNPKNVPLLQWQIIKYFIVALHLNSTILGLEGFASKCPQF